MVVSIVTLGAVLQLIVVGSTVSLSSLLTGRESLRLSISPCSWSVALSLELALESHLTAYLVSNVADVGWYDAKAFCQSICLKFRLRLFEVRWYHHGSYSWRLAKLLELLSRKVSIHSSRLLRESSDLIRITRYQGLRVHFLMAFSHCLQHGHVRAPTSLIPNTQRSHQVFSCLLIGFGLIFVPESPRWLISKDRPQDAQRALDRIHKKNDDIVVQDEVDAMVNAREAERLSSGGESRWADVFKGTQRRRFLCAFGILVCQQSEFNILTFL